MGLHVNIDQIRIDNVKKQGVRKCGFLVNQQGKLTPEEKLELQGFNQEKYGLTPEEVKNIKLPAAKYLVEIYDITKITNPKSKLSVIEKMNHLIKLEEALLNKLQLFKEKKITFQGGNQGRLQSMMSAAANKRRSSKNVNSDIDEDAADDEREEDAEF
jgi:hypothetical protein